MKAVLIPLGLSALVVLSACAQFPELDAARTPGIEDAPYPALIPLDPVLKEPAAPVATPEVIDNVTARAEGLASRADRLSQQRAAQQADVARRLLLLRQRAEQLRAQN